ncbi:MAG: hypothetical protein SFY32_13475 [Bacteroidota bacterium]|nr:hypothetical protein [Bacteroidota bacterium]
MGSKSKDCGSGWKDNKEIHQKMTGNWVITEISINQVNWYDSIIKYKLNNILKFNFHEPPECECCWIQSFEIIYNNSDTSKVFAKGGMWSFTPSNNRFNLSFYRNFSCDSNCYKNFDYSLYNFYGTYEILENKIIMSKNPNEYDKSYKKLVLKRI